VKFILKASVVVSIASMSLYSVPSSALDLDWSGHFRAESHNILKYTMDSGSNDVDTQKIASGGYYIPGSNNKNAYFQTLFLSLKPTVIVNDNIYIKSDWWVGDPVYGFFGSGVPYSADQRQFNSNQSGGSTVVAQRYWAEFLSEVGTVHVGRAPLHYGLGIVWNEGNRRSSRYHSTGDVVRLISKFGSFKFAPGVVKHSMGNSLVGACLNPASTGSLDSNTGVCTATAGGSGHGNVTDYSIMFEYDNIEEEMTLGLHYLKRVAGFQQDLSGYQTAEGTSGGSNYQIWDIFAKKEFGKVTIAGELPVVTGTVGSLKYTTWALALENKIQFSDRFGTLLKIGKAPGQPNIQSGTPDSFKAFYFNPDYRLGMVMFNYQFRNFTGPNSLNNPAGNGSLLVSPFDNPIVNAYYVSLSGNYQLGKWGIRGGGVWAQAIEVAEGGTTFFNTWDRNFYSAAAGVSDQKKSLGWEMDYGVTYIWDDYFSFDFDLGFYFPGDYYKFANLANKENGTETVYTGILGATVSF